MLMAPIILILLAVALVFGNLSAAFADVAAGGSIRYSEEVFQDYADAQYRAEFGSSTAYEDNILIVVLTDEGEHTGYYCIAWVGDHINSNINMMFGDETTAFGRAMYTYVNVDSYKYSLDSNMAQVAEKMTQEIKGLNLNSSFKCDEEHVQVTSHLTNKTELPMTEDTVNRALQEFTEQTGIPMVIVVEEAEEVFGRTILMSSVLWVLVGLVMIGVAVYLIVKAVKNKKSGGDTGPSSGHSGSGSSYGGYH